MKKKIEELNRISKEEFKASKKLPLIVILDDIRSQHNTGSIFRTADAFRVGSIHLCGITACPPNKEIEKSALGATDSVDWEYFNSASESILELKKKNFTIIGIEQSHNSVDFKEIKPASYENPLAIVLGNEVFGINDKIIPLCDFIIELPQHGTKHSLNVSICAGISIWEIYRRSISTYHFF